VRRLWEAARDPGRGHGLCNIERIEGTLARFGDRFRTRVFTETELRKARSRPWRGGDARQALGGQGGLLQGARDGLRMGIAWRDMAVSNLRTGQPVMWVTGWAAERLASMTPHGHEALIHVTLTDDYPWAQAFVVIEARPLGGSSPS
jgi:holo-[acyl-carrier protein] synthase